MTFSVLFPPMSFLATTRILPSSSELASRRVPILCPATSVESETRFIVRPALVFHGEEMTALPMTRPEMPKFSPSSLFSSPKSNRVRLTDSVSFLVDEYPPLTLMDWFAHLALRLSILTSPPFRLMADSDTFHAASSYQMKDGSVLAWTVSFPSSERPSLPER